jgi:hypothetical protein
MSQESEHAFLTHLCGGCRVNDCANVYTLRGSVSSCQQPNTSQKMLLTLSILTAPVNLRRRHRLADARCDREGFEEGGPQAG